MIRKEFRLPVQTFPRSAKTIFKNGHLILKTAPNNLDHNRVGIIFRSAKTTSSVERNRLKRRIFDFFQLSGKFKSAKTQEGKDLLILLNPAIMNLTKEELTELLKNHGNVIQ